MKRQVLKTIILFVIAIFGVFGANAQQKGDPPAVKNGLWVKRSFLINQMHLADSTMVFKRVTDVNGEENYIGVDADGTTLQVIGNEGQLKKIVFTFKFTTNKEVNYLQYRRMSYCTSIISGKIGLEWLDECSASFIKDPKSAVDNFKVFEYGVKALYKYQPANKAIILTFTTWEL